MADSTKICALRSGSSGNAIYIGSKARILVDVGVCGRAVEQSMRAIGEEAAALDALIVTHEHTDHTSGIGVLMRRYKIPLYTSPATWEAMRTAAGRIDSDLVNLIRPGQSFTVGDLDITGFTTPHDAIDPVGYRIETPGGAVSVMTDIGYLADGLLQNAAGSKAIFLEANYDLTMLMNGYYPYFLKKRISGRQGHLSNDDCALAVNSLLAAGTEYFCLSHLSKDNNSPDLALMTVEQKLAEIGACAGRDLVLDIARRYEVSRPYTF